jgi:hypothetical protein
VAEGNTVYSSKGSNAIIEAVVDGKTQEVSYKLVAGCKTTVIPADVTEIGAYAFFGCSGLTSITIPGSVKVIGESAFCACPNLTDVTISEGVEDVDGWAFEDCVKLTNVIIPSTVESISMATFRNCVSLNSITLPASIKQIDDDAFENCTGLTEIVCLATKCPKTTIDAFPGVAIENITLRVPESAVEAYQTDAFWSLFGTIESADGAFVAPNVDNETAIVNLKGDAKVQSVYNLGGQQTARMQRGINIVRLSDGTTRKVLVK